MPKSKEWEHLEKELQTKRTEGAAIGAATGGLLGVLIGLATFTIPGLEPFLAVGPIVAALADAAAVGAVGAPCSEYGYRTMPRRSTNRVWRKGRY